MSPSVILGRVASYMFLVLSVLTVISEWTGSAIMREAAILAVIPTVLLLAPLVPWKRRLFIIIALTLTAIVFATRADAVTILERGLYTAAFVGAFFVSLTMLSDASSSAASLNRAGQYLAEQPPGRRYLALTVGGHLFGLCLSYGSVALLGGLAENVAKREPNLEVRHHRLRRMLLAVQRGFISTLAWSPLGFSMAISTTLVPGATWADAVGPCLVSAAIYAGSGWALDTIFKPRLGRPSPQRASSERRFFDLWPLFALLLVLVATLMTLNISTGQSVVSIVMLIVPAISLGWIALQNSSAAPVAAVLRRASAYFTDVLPRYRTELLLLPTAGFIGVVGAALVKPLVVASGLHLETLPPLVILMALVWIFPIAGQVGMNPILVVSLFAPLLPDPAAIGVAPSAVIMSITAGWVLGAATSPFTATTLLIGGLGGVSATHVGWRWNGLYTLVSGGLTCLWIAWYAGLI